MGNMYGTGLLKFSSPNLTKIHFVFLLCERQIFAKSLKNICKMYAKRIYGKTTLTVRYFKGQQLYVIFKLISILKRHKKSSNFTTHLTLIHPVQQKKGERVEGNRFAFTMS